MAHTVAAIAHTLARLADELGGASNMSFSLNTQPAAPSGTGLPHEDPQTKLKLAKSYLVSRRQRERLFEEEGLFADPAWDMLIDLYIHRLEGRRVTVSSLCIASAVPATTALRWIGRLVESGIAIRSADKNDGRLAVIEISNQSAEHVCRYFDEFFPR